VSWVACCPPITQDEYDKKARELKERQTEVAARIEQHQNGEGDFRATLESLISVASRAAELFERSKTEQKRQLLAFVFSNLQLRGKKLEFSLRSPFDLMVNRRDHSSWLGRQDSNLRMAQSKSSDKAKGRKDGNVRVKERNCNPSRQTIAAPGSSRRAPQPRAQRSQRRKPPRIERRFHLRAVSCPHIPSGRRPGIMR
jgi:hypothetical protein